MIPNDLLRTLPMALQAEAVMQRDLLSDYDDKDREGVPELLEQAAEVAEELLRLRHWQVEVWQVLIGLRALAGNAPGLDDTKPGKNILHLADRLIELREHWKPEEGL